MTHSFQYDPEDPVMMALPWIRKEDPETMRLLVASFQWPASERGDPPDYWDGENIVDRWEAAMGIDEPAGE